MKGVSIVIGGVGGQGVILVARVLAEASLAEGRPAMMTEVHGMSQRYGSVVSTVRFGAVRTPLVGRGGADAIAGFEPLETARLLPLTHRKSVVVTATAPIRPLPVVLGTSAYPRVEDLVREMEERTARVVALDADRIARSIGAPVVANSVLLGALVGTKVPPVGPESVKDALKRAVPERTAAANLEAFQIGYGIAVEDAYSIQFA